MFEGHGYAEWELQAAQPDFDIANLDRDALFARDPLARQYFEDDPGWEPDPAREAELDAMPLERPERIWLEEDRPLRERDPQTFTDAEAITRLVEVEAGIARSHALRADLVALVASQRPATVDRPADRPGAGSRSTGATGDYDGADVVPEVLEVSEWLPHELQMAHPYSFTAAQDLVETSLVLTGRLTGTLGLLRAGRIDYRRAHILTDLLGACTELVSHTVEAMVLPKAPVLTRAGSPRRSAGPWPTLMPRRYAAGTPEHAG